MHSLLDPAADTMGRWTFSTFAVAAGLGAAATARAV